MAISNELLTVVEIFSSKYLSKANESKKSENKEINIDGIKVNNVKKVMYFLFAFEPDKSTSIFKELLTPTKIMKNRTISKTVLKIRSSWRFWSLNLIKLLSINVKNVKKPIDNVIINKITINIFFFDKINHYEINRGI